MGREVSLPKATLRIVSLAPTNTEFLFALGLGVLTSEQIEAVCGCKVTVYPHTVYQVPQIALL